MALADSCALSVLAQKFRAGLPVYYGGTLTVDAGALKCALRTVPSELITNVSTKEILGDESGKNGYPINELPQLSTPEPARFKSYINQGRSPGTRIKVVSLPADRLYYSIRVYYRSGVLPAALHTAYANTMVALPECTTG